MPGAGVALLIKGLWNAADFAVVAVLYIRNRDRYLIELVMFVIV
jgi:hypothetical protein